MAAKTTFMLFGIGLLPAIAIAQDANQPATRGDLEAVVMRLESKLSQWQQTTDDRLAKLEADVKTISDGQAAGQQVLEQIANRDPAGRSYIRIDASHEPTRNELRRAIQQVSPKIGTVVIQNKTDYNQSVAVNGTTYDVLANSNRNVQVAYGPFTVRTSNNRTLNWHFNYPETTTRVNLVSRPRPATVSSVPMYISYIW